MKIQVTQEDIDNGWPLDSCMCPVALAIKRHITEFDTLVGYYSKLPDECYKFMRSFDKQKSVQPFEFEIDL